MSFGTVGQIVRNSAELEVITTILPFIMTTMNADITTGEIITEYAAAVQRKITLLSKVQHRTLLPSREVAVMNYDDAEDIRGLARAIRGNPMISGV
jgi:hypothetical protein